MEITEKLPGMAVALKAREEAIGRVESIRSRKALAEATINLRTKDRAALVSRFVTGDESAASEVSTIDAQIRDATATAQLLSEALPGAEKVAKETEVRIGQIRHWPFIEAHREAKKTLDAAIAARDAAHLALNEADINVMKTRAAADFSDPSHFLRLALREADLETSVEAGADVAQAVQRSAAA